MASNINETGVNKDYSFGQDNDPRVLEITLLLLRTILLRLKVKSKLYKQTQQN